MQYMVTFTFTINIPPMLVYIPYMDPMGDGFYWFLEPFWSQDIAGASPGRCREALPVKCSTTR